MQFSGLGLVRLRPKRQTMLLSSFNIQEARISIVGVGLLRARAPLMLKTTLKRRWHATLILLRAAPMVGAVESSVVPQRFSAHIGGFRPHSYSVVIPPGYGPARQVQKAAGCNRVNHSSKSGRTLRTAHYRRPSI